MVGGWIVAVGGNGVGVAGKPVGGVTVTVGVGSTVGDEVDVSVTSQAVAKEATRMGRMLIHLLEFVIRFIINGLVPFVFAVVP